VGKMCRSLILSQQQQQQQPWIDGMKHLVTYLYNPWKMMELMCQYCRACSTLKSSADCQEEGRKDLSHNY